MAQVKLYVYDLTNGLAKQVSPSLVGRLIEGVWHTSIVAFRKEIFYGRGICVTNPGESHHGSPHRILEMGQTQIDEETFWEYVEGIREMYTADKYHLLDFNCNSFTEDLVGFLTGGSIPKYIKDLPSDFLETPFGRALRPTIDSMFPGTGTSRQAPSISSQSQPTTSGTGGIGTITSPLHVLNTRSHLDTFLSSHAASVILFTSATCPPCRAIAPVYERLAAEHTSLKHTQSQGSGGTSTGLKWKGVGKRIGFAKTDVSLGPEVAREFGIQATPTFIFLEGKQYLSELKGADPHELTRRVEDLSSFVHRASKGRLEELVESGAGQSIIYDKAPPFDVVRGKIGDEDGIPGKVCDKLKAKGVFGNVLVAEWVGLTGRILRPGGEVDLDRVWPLLDLWRVAVLSDPDVAKAVTGVLPSLFDLLPTLQGGSESKAEKNTRLVAMRLVSNVLSLSTSGETKVASSPMEVPPSFLVPSLLSDDTALRTCAAGVCLLLSSKARAGGDNDSEWNVEVFCALVEVLGREDLDLSSPSKTLGKAKEASALGGKDRDGVKRIIACLAVLLLSAREDILDLVDALGVVDVVKKRKAGRIDEEMKELLTELEGLILG